MKWLHHNINIYIYIPSCFILCLSTGIVDIPTCLCSKCLCSCIAQYHPGHPIFINQSNNQSTIQFHTINHFVILPIHQSLCQCVLIITFTLIGSISVSQLQTNPGSVVGHSIPLVGWCISIFSSTPRTFQDGYPASDFGFTAFHVSLGPVQKLQLLKFFYNAFCCSRKLDGQKVSLHLALQCTVAHKYKLRCD